jgi:Xaa-Pro aminopeptidase
MTTSLAGSTASLVLVQENLVDTIWANQPPRPQNPITVLDLKFSGCKYQDKLQEIRSSLIKGGHWGVILTALDDIACYYF